MKIIKKTVFEVRVPIYGKTVRVFLGYADTEATKIVEKETGAQIAQEGEIGDAWSLKLVDRRGRTVYYLVCPTFAWTIGEQGNLFHELTHVSCAILKTCGVDITEGNNEALCYLQSFLFEEIARRTINALKDKP